MWIEGKEFLVSRIGDALVLCPDLLNTHHFGTFQQCCAASPVILHLRAFCGPIYMESQSAEELTPQFGVRE